VETTGLYNSDRVVEIAVVTVNSAGQATEEFETLVQPQRDVSATWIHGIDAGMLRDATTFADVAQHIASRVDGAIVAGRNVRFDMRMGGNEFTRRHRHRLGRWSGHPRPTRCKLEQACGELAYPSTASTGHSSAPERPPNDARAGPFVRADLPAGGCSATDGHADAGVPAAWQRDHLGDIGFHPGMGRRG
jgi:Exonuclease